MATATSECTARIHYLDQKYQDGLHRSDLINRDENERRLALKALALKDTNAALEDLAAEREIQIFSLKEEGKSLSLSLSEAEDRASQRERCLEQQKSEIHSLKLDIENLSSSTALSNEAKVEKAALARELNTLRPELEQLKSQLASHQVVVASNGDLRRQLNSLEVELENEKRATTRVQKAEENGTIADLRAKIQQFEAKLTAEKKEKDSAKRELSESLSQQEQLKERLNTVKSKLKGSQNELKDAQADLQQSRREASTSQPKAPTKHGEPKKVSPKRKQSRLVAEPSISSAEVSFEDVDIQTPGNGHRAESQQPRRRGAEHAPLGEKSNFSITPFLNKSRDATENYHELDSDMSESSAAESSPQKPRDRRNNRSKQSQTKTTERPAATRRQATNPPTRRKAEMAAEPSKPILQDSNTMPKPSARKRVRLGAHADLGNVNDEKENSESDGKSGKPELVLNEPAKEGDAPTKAPDVEVDGRKRRRKLLGGNGPTMFDEDEADTASNPLRLAPVKRGRAQLGGVTNAFAGAGATFSPLKRQKRGGNGTWCSLGMLDWLVECLAGPGVNYRDCGHGQISQRDFHSFRNQNHDIMNSTQGLSIRTIGLNCPLLVKPWTRAALRFSSSNARWKQRQGKDAYARDAKVQGLKSRAAFKLLEMDAKYRLFKPGNVVVDLGYAPGSWSQVALDRTRPSGKVVGIDLIPAEPPKGVATFQGDFLSPMVQKMVKDFISQAVHRSHKRSGYEPPEEGNRDVAVDQPSYIDVGMHTPPATPHTSSTQAVDIVLSDMSAPWEQTSGFNVNSLSNPYHRLMNTSGVAFRDHAGSMDLCDAALQFASETLKVGGHFVCKFYQGSEDKELEQRLKKMFFKVYREKPESSRNESKEAYFVALRRNAKS